MAKKAQAIGGPLIIGGRKLSLSRAVRAGDFVFLTGQVPFQDGVPMTSGTIEEQTRVILELIRETLGEAGCALSDVVKAMVWLRDQVINLDRAAVKRGKDRRKKRIERILRRRRRARPI